MRLTDRWIGRPRLLLRSRAGRRAGDMGRVLRDLAAGADTGVGVRLGKGRRMLLLLDPALVGELLRERAGDVTKGPGVRVTRPLLGDGLLTTEGEVHRRARRLVAPAFSPRRLAGYVEQFASSAAAVDWEDGQQVDLHAEMAGLTLDIVGRTLLGVDLADARGMRATLEGALTTFGSGTGPRMFGRQVPQRDPAATAEIHRVVDEIIDGRREHRSSDRGDVVSALLDAADEPDGLTPQEVHDNVITLMMAGHETTANSLSWTFHLLGDRPDVVDRIRSDGEPYTRAVVAEAMRLYPPAWIMTRTTSVDMTLGRWDVPAGSTVAASPLLLHHDARWFPDPERFDPDRWLDARKDAVPRFAYLPFGTGPRACIGEQFAWAEATTILGTLVDRWSATPDPAHVVRPEYRVTMRPGGGLPVTLHERG